MNLFNGSKFRRAVRLLTLGLLLIGTSALIALGTWLFQYQQDLAYLRTLQTDQDKQIQDFRKKIGVLETQISSTQGLSGKEKLQLRKDALSLEKEHLTLQKEQVALTHNRFAMKNALYTMLIQATQAAGSVLVVVTVYISWQNFRREQDKSRREQAEQTSEGFFKAIERLKENTLGARLAGIDFLKQVVETSPQQHWTVIEILAEHIRDRPPLPETGVLAVDQQSAPADICEAVRAISQIYSYPDLKNRKLILNYAHLGDINLRGATLQKAELIGVDFRSSDLTDADLSGTCMPHSNLSETILFSTRFKRAILNYANFGKANANRADFRYAELHYTVFSDAVLVGADFTDANFDQTNLKGANLKGARGLTQEQIDKAFGDNQTYLPDGLVLRDFR